MICQFVNKSAKSIGKRLLYFPKSPGVEGFKKNGQKNTQRYAPTTTRHYKGS